MQTHELVGRYSLERASSGFLAAVMLSLPLGTTVAQIFLFGESAVPWIAAMSFYGVMLVGHLALKAMKVPNLRAHQSINPVVAYRQIFTARRRPPANRIHYAAQVRRLQHVVIRPVRTNGRRSGARRVVRHATRGAPARESDPHDLALDGQAAA